MDCPQCHQEYSPLRLPRILTQCGHTLCESCLSSLFTEGNVLCPQCNSSTYAVSVSLLPVNQALLHLRNVTSSCPLHNKPLDAYCSTDQRLLCINCILSNAHQQHDIVSIEHAAEFIRFKLIGNAGNLKEIYEGVYRKNEELETLEREIRQEYEGIKQEISRFYTDLMTIIQSKHIETTDKMTKSLAMEMERIRVVREGNRRQVADLERVEGELQAMQRETDLVVVGKAGEREEKIACATVKPLNLTRNKPFEGWKKEEELKTLWAAIREKTGLSDPSLCRLSESPALSPQSIRPTSRTATALPGLEGVTVSVKPVEVKVVRTKSEMTDPLRASVSLVKSKTGSRRWKKQEEASMSVESYAPTELNTSIPGSFPGECSPISKVSASFISIDDTQSSKSLDLSSFGRSKPGTIYTFGGFSDRALSCVEKFDQVTSEWRAVTQLPVVRAQFGCIQRHQRIALIGGKIEGKRVASSEDFVISTGRCAEGAVKLPGIRSGFGLASLHDSLYIVGGSDGMPLKSTEILTNSTWSSGPNMKTRRDELSLVLGPDLLLYALGGYGGTDM